MPNFGLSYESLRVVRPDIITVAMPAFGSTGPYANRISFGPGIDAMSGIQFISGYAGGEPLKPGHVFSDYNTAMLGAYAVMVALYHRNRTGEGQRIDVAMREGVTFLLGDVLLDAAMNGRSPSRVGNRHPSMAPHNVIPAKSRTRGWLSRSPLIRNGTTFAMCLDIQPGPRRPTSPSSRADGFAKTTSIGIRTGCARAHPSRRWSNCRRPA